MASKSTKYQTRGSSARSHGQGGPAGSSYARRPSIGSGRGLSVSSNSAGTSVSAKPSVDPPTTQVVGDSTVSFADPDPHDSAEEDNDETEVEDITVRKAVTPRRGIGQSKVTPTAVLTIDLTDPTQEEVDEMDDQEEEHDTGGTTEYPERVDDTFPQDSNDSNDSNDSTDSNEDDQDTLLVTTAPACNATPNTKKGHQQQGRMSAPSGAGVIDLSGYVVDKHAPKTKPGAKHTADPPNGPDTSDVKQMFLLMMEQMQQMKQEAKVQAKQGRKAIELRTVQLQQAKEEMMEAVDAKVEAIFRARLPPAIAMTSSVLCLEDTPALNRAEELERTSVERTEKRSRAPADDVGRLPRQTATPQPTQSEGKVTGIRIPPINQRGRERAKMVLDQWISGIRQVTTTTESFVGDPRIADIMWGVTETDQETFRAGLRASECEVEQYHRSIRELREELELEVSTEEAADLLNQYSEARRAAGKLLSVVQAISLCGQLDAESAALWLSSTDHNHRLYRMARVLNNIMVLGRQVMAAEEKLDLPDEIGSVHSGGVGEVSEEESEISGESEFQFDPTDKTYRGVVPKLKPLPKHQPTVDLYGHLSKEDANTTRAWVEDGTGKGTYTEEEWKDDMITLIPNPDEYERMSRDKLPLPINAVRLKTLKRYARKYVNGPYPPMIMVRYQRAYLSTYTEDRASTIPGAGRGLFALSHRTDNKMAISSIPAVSLFYEGRIHDRLPTNISMNNVMEVRTDRLIIPDLRTPPPTSMINDNLYCNAPWAPFTNLVTPDNNTGEIRVETPIQAGKELFMPYGRKYNWFDEHARLFKKLCQELNAISRRQPMWQRQYPRGSLGAGFTVDTGKLLFVLHLIVENRMEDIRLTESTIRSLGVTNVEARDFLVLWSVVTGGYESPHDKASKESWPFNLLAVNRFTSHFVLGLAEHPKYAKYEREDFIQVFTVMFEDRELYYTLASCYSYVNSPFAAKQAARAAEEGREQKRWVDTWKEGDFPKEFKKDSKKARRLVTVDSGDEYSPDDDEDIDDTPPRRGDRSGQRAVQNSHGTTGSSSNGGGTGSCGTKATYSASKQRGEWEPAKSVESVETPAVTGDPVTTMSNLCVRLNIALERGDDGSAQQCIAGINALRLIIQSNPTPAGRAALDSLERGQEAVRHTRSSWTPVVVEDVTSGIHTPVKGKSVEGSAVTRSPSMSPHKPLSHVSNSEVMSAKVMEQWKKSGECQLDGIPVRYYFDEAQYWQSNVKSKSEMSVRKHPEIKLFNKEADFSIDEYFIRWINVAESKNEHPHAVASFLRSFEGFGEKVASECRHWANQHLRTGATAPSAFRPANVNDLDDCWRWLRALITFFCEKYRIIPKQQQVWKHLSSLRLMTSDFSGLSDLWNEVTRWYYKLNKSFRFSCDLQDVMINAIYESPSDSRGRSGHSNKMEYLALYDKVLNDPANDGAETQTIIDQVVSQLDKDWKMQLTKSNVPITTPSRSVRAQQSVIQSPNVSFDTTFEDDSAEEYDERYIAQQCNSAFVPAVQGNRWNNSGNNGGSNNNSNSGNHSGNHSGNNRGQTQYPMRPSNPVPLDGSRRCSVCGDEGHLMMKCSLKDQRLRLDLKCLAQRPVAEGKSILARARQYGNISRSSEETYTKLQDLLVRFQDEWAQLHPPKQAQQQQQQQQQHRQQQQQQRP